MLAKDMEFGLLYNVSGVDKPVLLQRVSGTGYYVVATSGEPKPRTIAIEPDDIVSKYKVPRSSPWWRRIR